MELQECNTITTRRTSSINHEVEDSKEMFGISLTRLLIVGTLFLTGCTSMPLSTMHKLHRLDPMDADPAQIKVAIRTDDRIGIRKGGASIEVKFDAEDGTLSIDETFIIEIIRNPIMSTKLVENKKPGESVTVLQLTKTDAQRLKLLQSSLLPYRQGERRGTGSFGVGLTGICLHGPIPVGEVLVNIFLQTSDNDGFYVFVRNLELKKKLEQEGITADEWSNCQEKQIG